MVRPDVWPEGRATWLERSPRNNCSAGGSQPAKVWPHSHLLGIQLFCLCWHSGPLAQHPVSGESPVHPCSSRPRSLALGICYSCPSVNLPSWDLAPPPPRVVAGIAKEGSRRSRQSCMHPPVIPGVCFLELSKSQNDMTSDKHLLSTGPRLCASRSERRSQSDTAINVTIRVCPGATRPPQDCFLAYFL